MTKNTKAHLLTVRTILLFLGGTFGFVFLLDRHPAVFFSILGAVLVFFVYCTIYYSFLNDLKGKP